MSKDEKIKIGREILNESECKFEIHVNNEDVFIMRAPQIRDMAMINARRNYYLGGAEFTQVHPDIFRACTAYAYVSVLLVQFPEWWEGVDDCYDSDLIVDIYNDFDKKYEKFKERIKKNKR